MEVTSRRTTEVVGIFNTKKQDNALVFCFDSRQGDTV
jgi:hypothetical protein